MTPLYVALIGDATASRALPPPVRARLQRDLATLLATLNRRWRRSLAARFAITRGDEFQCLLLSAQPVWEIVNTVRAELDQVDWTIGCGRGVVSTVLTKGIAAPEVDGPCFHHARAAAEEAKRRRLLIAFQGFGDADAALDGWASYHSALYWSWTPRQRHAARLLRAGGGAGAVAQQLDVHRTAVSHFARRMAWPLVVAGDTMFRRLLDPHVPTTGDAQ